MHAHVRARVWFSACVLLAVGLFGRFMAKDPFSLKPLFRNHRNQNVEKFSRVMECALTLLIWGEVRASP